MTADEAARLDSERRDADARYNEALTALDRAIVSLDGGELSRDDARRVGSALLVFLQQITAFVDTKDRLVAAQDKARTDALARALERVDELSVQTALLQRAISGVASRESGVGSQSGVGSRESVGSRE